MNYNDEREIRRIAREESAHGVAFFVFLIYAVLFLITANILESHLERIGALEHQIRVAPLHRAASHK